MSIQVNSNPIAAALVGAVERERDERRRLDAEKNVSRKSSHDSVVESLHSGTELENQAQGLEVPKKGNASKITPFQHKAYFEDPALGHYVDIEK